MGRFLLQRHLAIPSSEQAKKVEVALCSVSWVVGDVQISRGNFKDVQGKGKEIAKHQPVSTAT